MSDPSTAPGAPAPGAESSGAVPSGAVSTGAPSGGPSSSGTVPSGTVGTVMTGAIGQLGSAGADAGSEVLLLRALSRAPGTDDAIGTALRTGVLRRRGQGQIAGVCAALAVAGGIPVRLVRLVALGTLLLGIGLPGYLVLLLLLPRENDDGPEHVDRPLDAIARLHPRRGDLLIGLAIIPAVLLSIYWFALVMIVSGSPFVVLVPVVGAGVVLLAWAARRARRARRRYAVAALARRAGILEEDELEAVIARLVREAPAAWLRTDPDAAAVLRARSARRRPRRSSSRALSARASVVAVGALLAVWTAVFLTISLIPSWAPALSQASALPIIGDLGAGAAVAAAVAGMILVALGMRRRHSVVIAACGLLALAVFGTSVVWVRMTDDRGTTPIVVAYQQYVPSETYFCPEDPSSWNRPVVIDLSQLRASTTDPVAATASFGAGASDGGDGSAGGGATAAMWISCTRPVGDVTIILPPETDALPIASTLSTRWGTTEGNAPSSMISWDEATVGVRIDGDLGIGDLRFEEAPA